jgi:hypothetical protein
MAVRKPLVVVSGAMQELPSGDSISVGGWTLVGKTSDQSKTNSAALTNDSELAFNLAASTRYAIRGKIFFDTGATGDFKWRHVAPSGATTYRLRRGWILPGTTAFAGIAVDTAPSAADLALAGTGTTGGFIEFEAVIANGLTAGTFAFAWAQNTSDPTATTVKASSYLEYAII